MRRRIESSASTHDVNSRNPRKVISRDGLTLAVDIEGPENGPRVVFLHGGGQTRHSWSGAAQIFSARGYRVVNYDARGHGESEWSPEGAYSLSDRVEDLCAILALENSPYALVGASLGGATALVGAAGGLTPEAIVLVDIVPEPEHAGIARITRFMSSYQDGFASVGEAIDAVEKYNPHRPRPRDPTGLMRNLRRHADGRLYWHWDPCIVTADPDEHHAEVRQAVAQLAERRPCPIMLVRGMASDVVSDRGVEKFRQMLPSLEVRDVRGAGHMVAGDRNDAFQAAALEFLEQRLPS